MSGLMKILLRAGVITVLVGGAVAVVAGPHRTHAMLRQAHGSLMSLIDENIEDPVALREQLRELEAEYPRRIAQVRADLAELDEQEHQIDRDRAIAERVVALADTDLEELEPVLAEAEVTRVEVGGPRLVHVRFRDRSYSLDQARVRAGQIRQTRTVYASRAVDAERDLGYLRQQSTRLEELLLQLETERAQFQAQLLQLERQVDAIARNDRLIELMEEREKTIEECSRYEVASLDQLQGHLSQIRSRQESELESLAHDGRERDYEELARIQIESEGIGGERLLESDPSGASPSSPVRAETSIRVPRVR